MTRKVYVHSYTRRGRRQLRTRGAANADGGSAQAPILSAFGLLDGYSLLPEQSGFPQPSVRRHRDYVVGSEPQYDRVSLFPATRTVYQGSVNQEQ